MDNTDTNCSDQGTGTEQQPFCTLAAVSSVVTAGQTVHIPAGIYHERLTVTRSGSPEAPITFRSDPWNPAALSGTTAGISIDGQHDIAIVGLAVHGYEAPGPAVTISNSTRITLSLPDVWASQDPASAGIRLAAVTDSLIRETGVQGEGGTGIVLDASTSEVTVDSSWVLMYSDSSTAIELAGPGNTVINTEVEHAGTAIRVLPDADNNVVANNRIYPGPGRGIHNTDADGTAITNNHVESRCGTGIRVDGTSSGVSVQNNVTSGNGEPVIIECDPASTAGEVNIGLYDEAAAHAVVDYNNVHSHNGRSMYSWQGVPMNVTDFRAVSGQAAHDLDTDDSAARIDSANSAAPGWQPTDIHGYGRVDDPNHPDTGAGAVSYADRGVSERVSSPAVRASVTAQRTRVGTLVTADASASTVWAPLTIARYTFDFGDGTVITQATPIASHTYPGAGTATLRITVTDSNGLSSRLTTSDWTYITPPRRSVTPSRWTTRNRTAW